MPNIRLKNCHQFQTAFFLNPGAEPRKHEAQIADYPHPEGGHSKEAWQAALERFAVDHPRYVTVTK